MTETKSENKSFAYKQFKKLCSKHNLNPYQVSIRSNGVISTAVLSQWKNGEYELKLDKLKALADVFGEPVTVFIE